MEDTSRRPQETQLIGTIVSIEKITAVVAAFIFDFCDGIPYTSLLHSFRSVHDAPEHRQLSTKKNVSSAAIHL